jgi:hypothetical protein
MRNVLGSLLALIGAAATLVSPWQPWYNNRHGSGYKFYEVFGSGITPSGSAVMDSVFLVFLVMAILTVVGVLFRSRALVGCAGVVALGFTILWMVRQGQAAGELTITGANNRGLGSGVAWAFAGSLLMITGSLLMTGRRRRVVEAETVGTAGTAGTTRTGAAAGTAATGAAVADEPVAEHRGHWYNRGFTSATTTPRETAPADRQPTAAAPSERTGTERLSKEEREMLGLDEDASARPKDQK